MSDLDIFHGPNAGYALELYDRYRQDPASVDPATRAFFETWTPDGGEVQADGGAPAATAAPEAPVGAPLDITRIVGAARLIRYIRELGHLAARIDPLGGEPPGDPGLLLSIHGVTESDLEALPADIVRGPLVEGSRSALEAVEKLRLAYEGSIGYETDHIQTFEERAWIRESIEDGRFFQGFDTERKRDLLERLTEVETFERFLHQTFLGQKRFSLEGNDMLVPMLDSIIRNAAAAGTREVVLGMSHRGRLNVLAHVLGKPYAAILHEFESASRDGGAAPSEKGTLGWTGDVKYHLGARRAYRDSGIDQMPLTLMPNPSHLEFVDPVVVGSARAAQERRDQRGAPVQDEKASLAILMHGDAAFPGQGVVAETLNLSQLPGYHTGGTIHIIVNNQIGFTTGKSDARSTLYASDLAKGFEIPILHVNADDPEACIAAARMAIAYVERFHKDFLIDLVGYRRHGHNEGDEPTFTQPRMYEVIAAHPTVRELWARTLEEQGIVSPEDAAAMVRAVQQQLQQARGGHPADDVPQEDQDEAAQVFTRDTGAPATAVPAEWLHEFNEGLLRQPEAFTMNPKLERFFQRRRAAFAGDSAIDWAHAEALAFASILADGTPIRMTGQDVERGTFSHRHLVLRDVRTGERHVPLQELPAARASFAIHNSPLSEAGVLGFEYGYSAHAPGVLVLWEAQFGDFANSAQVIIDQFIISGGAKWRQRPGLVLLLPHGYEGQGPEHSSARLERFLQLAAGDNIRVANCTTAAQYFHLLRRQAALLERDPRPLVLMTPKSLLRHPRAASPLADLATGTFQPVLDDPTAQERVAEVTRLILCSGKVYVDLVTAGQVAGARHIAVARIEELHPFPAAELEALIGRYPNVREFVWLQEEPRNMGAWHYVAPRLREVLGRDANLHYIGRPEFASPAEGSLRQHTAIQAHILE
ncbi:MAG: 2-oxoglutarate dehydrogenase E1 component, partial [Chloroflexota bacterium]|nr:2-oxoglutarate dehydrogenase E1 component [Chloroflexota bacterium]